MTITTMPRPKVCDPIIFRAERDGAEFVARPCSGRHRAHFLNGYLVLSCSKCTINRLDQEPADFFANKVTP